MALQTSDTGALRVQDIYKFIESKFPFFKTPASGAWKNSLRHSLSLGICFHKLPVKTGFHGRKGFYWAVVPGKQAAVDKEIAKYLSETGQTLQDLLKSCPLPENDAVSFQAHGTADQTEPNTRPGHAATKAVTVTQQDVLSANVLAPILIKEIKEKLFYLVPTINIVELLQHLLIPSTAEIQTSATQEQTSPQTKNDDLQDRKVQISFLQSLSAPTLQTADLTNEPGCSYTNEPGCSYGNEPECSYINEPGCSSTLKENPAAFDVSTIHHVMQDMASHTSPSTVMDSYIAPNPLSACTEYQKQLASTGISHKMLLKSSGIPLLDQANAPLKEDGILNKEPSLITLCSAEEHEPQTASTDQQSVFSSLTSEPSTSTQKSCDTATKILASGSQPTPDIAEPKNALPTICIAPDMSLEEMKKIIDEFMPSVEELQRDISIDMRDACVDDIMKQVLAGADTIIIAEAEMNEDSTVSNDTINSVEDIIPDFGDSSAFEQLVAFSTDEVDFSVNNSTFINQHKETAASENTAQLQDAEEHESQTASTDQQSVFSSLTSSTQKSCDTATEILASGSQPTPDITEPKNALPTICIAPDMSLEEMKKIIDEFMPSVEELQRDISVDMRYACVDDLMIQVLAGADTIIIAEAETNEDSTVSNDTINSVEDIIPDFGDSSAFEQLVAFPTDEVDFSVNNNTFINQHKGTAASGNTAQLQDAVIQSPNLGDTQSDDLNPDIKKGKTQNVEEEVGDDTPYDDMTFVFKQTSGFTGLGEVSISHILAKQPQPECSNEDCTKSSSESSEIHALNRKRARPEALEVISDSPSHDWDKCKKQCLRNLHGGDDQSSESQPSRKRPRSIEEPESNSKKQCSQNLFDCPTTEHEEPLGPLLCDWTTWESHWKHHLGNDIDLDTKDPENNDSEVVKLDSNDDDEFLVGFPRNLVKTFDEKKLADANREAGLVHTDWHDWWNRFVVAVQGEPKDDHDRKSD